MGGADACRVRGGALANSRMNKLIVRTRRSSMNSWYGTLVCLCAGIVSE